MSILFDKWKTFSSLEEVLEEEQQYIQEEKEKKKNSLDGFYQKAKRKHKEASKRNE